MKVIHDDPPMRDEIAVGFYPQFEAGWRKAEALGRLLMIGFVAASVFGLFGHGLFSQRQTDTPDGSLSVRYEPVLRNGVPAVVVLDAHVPPEEDKVDVTISNNLLETFGIDHLVPAPSRWEVGNGGIRMEFPVLAPLNRIEIRLAGSPIHYGRARYWAREDGGDALQWSQFGIP